MNHKFEKYKLISYLPDITKWNTIRLVQMGKMFNALSYLPNIKAGGYLKNEYKGKNTINSLND